MLAGLVSLSLLGGVLTVEGTSVGQFMLSRPLVAGVLTGWIVGAPTAGLLAGAILELHLLVSFPVGGARFPEGGPAAVVAAAVAAPGSGAALAVGVATGLLWGQVVGLTTTALRELNGRIVATSGGHPGKNVTGRVLRSHLTALSVDVVRGSLLTATGIVVGRFVLRSAGGAWPLGGAETRALLLLGGLVSVGILVRSFGGLARRRQALLTGLGLGLLAGWLL